MPDRQSSAQQTETRVRSLQHSQRLPQTTSLHSDWSGALLLRPSPTVIPLFDLLTAYLPIAAGANSTQTQVGGSGFVCGSGCPRKTYSAVHYSSDSQWGNRKKDKECDQCSGANHLQRFTKVEHWHLIQTDNRMIFSSYLPTSPKQAAAHLIPIETPFYIQIFIHSLSGETSCLLCGCSTKDLIMLYLNCLDKENGAQRVEKWCVNRKNVAKIPVFLESNWHLESGRKSAVQVLFEKLLHIRTNSLKQVNNHNLVITDSTSIEKGEKIGKSSFSHLAMILLMPLFSAVKIKNCAN